MFYYDYFLILSLSIYIYISFFQKTHTDPATGVMLEGLIEPCAKLEEQLNLITDRASQLRDAS